MPEAAVYGVPVIIGPHNGKFREARDLIACGGCHEIKSPADFPPLMDRFLADKEFLANAGKAAGNYITSNSGATDQIIS